MNRKDRFARFALLLALAFTPFIAAYATDYFTWKPFDLYVKRNLYVNGHVLQGAPADGSGAGLVKVPTIAAGAGAGTSPTVSISGNDMGGVVTVTTGSSPTASAVVATVTLGNAFPTNTFTQLDPANGNAAALSGNGAVWPTTTTGTFVINEGSTGLTGTTTYKWAYQNTGN